MRGLTTQVTVDFMRAFSYGPEYPHLIIFSLLNKLGQIYINCNSN